MPSIDALIGKPFTFHKDGKKRVFAKITSAQVRDNKVYFAVTVTDREIAEQLGVEVPHEIEGVLPSGVQTT